MKKQAIFIFIMLICMIPIAAKEFIGDAQAPFPLNDTYKVEIKRGASDWETIQSHDAKIFWGTQHMSFAKFEDSFAEPVEIKVTKLNGNFKSAEIRPKSFFIEGNKVENTLTFTMNKPQKVSVEFDGDRWNNLFIFADNVETGIPDKNDENVLWYGPGVHDVGHIALKNNQTLYLHKDALVYGYFYATDVTNVKIMGRGILDSSKENMDYAKPRNSQLFFVNSSDVVIKDVTLRNTPTWNLVLLGCNNVHIDNIRQIGSNANSDGLDIVSSSNILIENTIQRNKDDNISIKGFNPLVDNKVDGMPSYLFDHSNVDDCFNITMRNCVLWADEAHNMLVGPDLKGRKAYNIHFENIDVLQNNQNDDVYPGVMAVMIADQGEYSDIHWKDIRVEDIESGQIVSLTYQNAYAMLGYGKSLKNVTFENISYIGTKASPSRILGLNATQNIDNVKFTNYRINGVPVTDFTTGNITANQNTINVTFAQGATDNPSGLIPVTRNQSIEIPFDKSLNFSYAYFSDSYNFIDPLSAIEITQIPAHGALTINGNAVKVGDIISATDLMNLKYTISNSYLGEDLISWCAICDNKKSNISNIKINVSPKKAIALNVGTTKTLCNSLDAFFNRSQNLTVDGGNASLLDGYTRINRTSDSNEYLVLKSDEDITYFDVLFYGYGASGAEGLLNLYVSADNSTWTPIATNKGAGIQTTPNSGWYRKNSIPTEQIPIGSRYIKVEYNISGNSWGTQIAAISLGIMKHEKSLDVSAISTVKYLPETASLYYENKEIELIPIIWDEPSADFKAGKIGVYDFKGNLTLPSGCVYTGSTEPMAIITLTDITNGVPPLSGTDDFMGRDENGNILYSDGTIAASLIANWDTNKTVKLGEKRFLSVSNIVNNGYDVILGWKVPTEGMQDRYAHIQRASESDSYIEYVVNENSNLEVELLMLVPDKISSAVAVSVTKDGENWEQLDYKIQNDNIKIGNYYDFIKIIVPVLPLGSKIARITLKSGEGNLPSWAPQILAVSSNPVNITVPENNTFKYVGRIDLSNPVKPDLIWSGSSVSANFSGTEITGIFSATNGKIAVYVDGIKTNVVNITKPMSLIEITGIADGDHSVTFRRASMVESGRITFNGVITNGTLLPPNELNKLKIEFFGNSVSEGAAASATVETDRDNRAFDDNSVAYSCLLASMLDADYHNTSICGVAVTDGSGWIPFGMQSRYNLIDPYNTESTWDFSKFKPLICIMALGINDTYKDNGVTDKAWRNNYKDLVVKIKEQYGSNTRFVFAIPPMIDENAMALRNLPTLVKDLRSMGIWAFHCAYKQPVTKGHPIAGEHLKIAQELYQFIIDNKLTDEVLVGVDAVNENDSFKIRSNNGMIIIDTTHGKKISVYDLAGRNQYINTECDDITYISVERGAYIVSIDNISQKIMVP